MPAAYDRNGSFYRSACSAAVASRSFNQRRDDAQADATINNAWTIEAEEEEPRPVNCSTCLCSDTRWSSAENRQSSPLPECECVCECAIHLRGPLWQGSILTTDSFTYGVQSEPDGSLRSQSQLKGILCVWAKQRNTLLLLKTLSVEKGLLTSSPLFFVSFCLPHRHEWLCYESGVFFVFPFFYTKQLPRSISSHARFAPGSQHDPPSGYPPMPITSEHFTLAQNPCRIHLKAHVIVTKGGEEEEEEERKKNVSSSSSCSCISILVH